MGSNQVPMPNIVAYRKQSGHAHAIYTLRRPVYRGPKARPFPLAVLVVRHVIIFEYGHGLQRAIIDESQHRTPERLIIAQRTRRSRPSAAPAPQR